MSETRADAVLDYHTASDEEFNKTAWTARRAGTQAYVQPEKEIRGGEYVFSSRGAVTVLRCSRTTGDDQDLFIVAKVQGSGKPAEAAMKEFIVTYSGTVAKSGPCHDEEGSGAGS